MLRFVGDAARRARRIRSSMRIRGILPRRVDPFIHPIRTGRHLLIPLLSTMLRRADQLAASAVLRGLGRPGAHTSIQHLGFGGGDVALLIMTIALVMVRVGGWESA